MKNSETCQYDRGWDGKCGVEAKFWYGPKWLCWDHYVVLTAVIRVSH